MLYSFDARIRYSETGSDAHLQIMSMINYLQDCCVLQCEDAGVGVAQLLKQNRAWYLLGWQIHIRRLPRLSEHVVVSTWPYDFSKLTVGRCFSMSDSEGNVCVEADSSWCLMDIERHRPVHVPNTIVEALLDPADCRLDLPPMRRKIELAGEAERLAPSEVSKLQLDTNKHVNNVQYAEMAIEALGVREAEVSRIDVQYKNAAVLGDTIVPVVRRGEDSGTIELLSAKGATFAAAKIYVRS